jgi:hypothetical protein
MRHRVVTVLCLLGVLGGLAEPAAARQASPSYEVRKNGVRIADWRMLSQGARTWFRGPHFDSGEGRSSAAAVSFGTNIDANNPTRDLAAGQSETAIAARGDRVMVGWNDISGVLIRDPRRRQASGTGVGVSVDGAVTFRDLIGLPNDDRRQQWFGDPTVVAMNAGHFLVGSLYLPAAFLRRHFCQSRLTIAVSGAKVRPDGSVDFSEPIVAANGGSPCRRRSAFLDKPFMSYDPGTRTVALSYTRFFNGGRGRCGTGQVEVKTAHVPRNPFSLSARSWSSATVVAPEVCSPPIVQTGSEPEVAPGGDIYVVWERNLITNFQTGRDPFVYIKAARIPAGTRQVAGRVTVSIGQTGAANDSGGVRSLDTVLIAGYNRGIGQDFPRVEFDAVSGRLLVEWNDASRHPLGDVWLKSLAADMSDNATAAISRVNDDASFALHFMPAISVRADGTICSSWYDRRLGGANSTVTDYFSECRPDPATNAPDVRITTGGTDWSADSSVITPNFGDYTDNTSTGARTYYTWSDGRIGVAQPFVDGN